MTEKPMLRTLYELADIIQTKIYYKGFNNHLFFILNAPKIITRVKDQDTQEKMTEELIKQLTDLNSHYKYIEEADINCVFPELVEIKKELQVLQVVVKNYLTTKNDKYLKSIKELIFAISSIGDEFGKSCVEIIEDIRKMTGNADYNLQTVDHKKDVFNIA